MMRQYHKWTSREFDRVRAYVRRTRHPFSPFNIQEFAAKLGIPFHAVRGAVQRVAAQMKSESPE